MVVVTIRLAAAAYVFSSPLQMPDNPGTLAFSELARFTSLYDRLVFGICNLLMIPNGPGQVQDLIKSLLL